MTSWHGTLLSTGPTLAFPDLYHLAKCCVYFWLQILGFEGSFYEQSLRFDVSFCSEKLNSNKVLCHGVRVWGFILLTYSQQTPS
jgi:hypothetical protein